VTEGPYYVDEDLNRGDIRSDPATGVVKEGALLELTFNVSQISEAGCTPLEGAKVEVWHCDAAGIYSDVSDPGFDTQGQKFLRGYQVTDATGQATLLTIYPAGIRAAQSTFISKSTRIHQNKAASSPPSSSLTILSQTRFLLRNPMLTRASATP
jgi:protocatechuate 3,4-dioxygenase beta subunit